ncbi:MAG: Fe-S oxidoreductase coenzyme synthesis protein [Candidatus Magnetoglobus multicellularis str. Araruama]|uniref:Fe-S oxidoreductase coenzyme synthesis protein n=1 Tax=Candidatus Magnetoglobus multicellularis str. Araruama TaxID=890399 RepID=A0A1V1P587_9BACT|nr:MAG: Fe-S oxidoreductase coenzyme synthesis protein [Candidatus Magnetoglobus multicellularis str. Araruama]
MKRISGLNFSDQEIQTAIQENKLLSFDLEFTRACNLNCLYCYAGGKKIENEMCLNEILSVIEQAVASGARQVVNIGGGEPLAYKYYWKILQKERDLGLKSITFTNGTWITQAIAQQLFDYNEGIALKLNSFNPDIQDFLTGQKGSSARIQDALQHLIKVGYGKTDAPELAIETIVCNPNYHEIETIYRFCRENNIIPYIEIMTLQGNARKNAQVLETSIAQNYQLFKKLLTYDQQHFGITWPLTPPIAGQSCKRLLYSMYVRSDGNVQVCPGIEIVHPDLNIRNHSIQWILDHSTIFQKARNIYQCLNGKCRICQHADCYGCRGTAFAQNGDFCDDDPTCWDGIMGYINEV